MVQIVHGSAAHFLNQLFGKLSEERLRESGLAALEHGTREGTRVVRYQAWMEDVLGILSNLPRGGGPAGALLVSDLASVIRHEARNHGASLPKQDYYLRRFWHWMVRVDYAVPLQADCWALTEAGERAARGEHALRPGTLQRLRSSCEGSGLEDSLDRLDDAQACLDAGLARPAVVLLGLAYEELISVVLARLTSKSVFDLKPGALPRQGELRKEIERHKQGEAKEGALLALNAADAIRRRRNSASHEARGEWDLHEAERLLASGVDAYQKLALYAPAS